MPTPETWPYSYRNGDTAETVAAQLTSKQRPELSETEITELYAFAGSLFAGTVGELQADTPRNLKEIRDINSITYQHMVYEGYLETEEGQEEQGSLGTGDFPLREQLLAAVATGKRIDNKACRTLAAKSAKWYRQTMTDGLKQDPKDDAEWTDLERWTVNLRPDLLLQKAADLQAYRRFYREVKGELRQGEPSATSEAKKLLLDFHIAKVNQLMATIYASLVKLAVQLDASPQTEQVEAWKDTLATVAPVVAQVKKAGHLGAFQAEFSRRLDHVRNGISKNEAGRIAAHGVLISSFAQDVETAAPPLKQDTQYLPETISYLQNTAWQAPQLKSFLETILEEWDLLSEHEADWHEASERSQPAADKKWQVIITPAKEALSVEGAIKVVLVPESFDWNLLQSFPAGALAVTAHELTHVLQAEADEALARRLPLAAIKGRRAVMGREMGGLHQELAVQKAFGQKRAFNTTYLRSLERKEQGGNELEVMRAFQETYARTAADGKSLPLKKVVASSMRLYQQNGYDTQPLDYLEQGMMLKELQNRMSDEEIAAITIAGTSFSLEDSAALQAVGLLEIPTVIDKRPAETVLKVYFEKFHRPPEE